MKKILKGLLLFVVGFFVFAFGQATYEAIAVRRTIKQFITKAELNESISTDKIKYYEVSRETYFPDEYERDPFYEGNLRYPGAEGDILTTRQAPFPAMPGIYQFITFFFGGHAAYVGPNNRVYETYGIFDDDEKFLDVLRYGGKNTYADTTSNYWLDPNYFPENHSSYDKFGSYYRTEWFGLRVKGATKEDVAHVTKQMDYIVDNKIQYNYFFVIFTKYKYYCTDMMSRPYETITNGNGQRKFNLNMDRFAVTVNDLILSNDTYLAYYVTTDRNNVKHVYYIN